MPDYRYKIHKGDSLVVDVTYRLSATPKAPKVPFDLTGSSVILAIKWPSGSITLSSMAGQIALGGASGTIVCDPVDTSDLPIGDMTSYQLRLKDSLGLEKTLLAGSIQVSPSSVEATE